MIKTINNWEALYMELPKETIEKFKAEHVRKFYYAFSYMALDNKPRIFIVGSDQELRYSYNQNNKSIDLSNGKNIYVQAGDGRTWSWNDTGTLYLYQKPDTEILARKSLEIHLSEDAAAKNTKFLFVFDSKVHKVAENKFVEVAAPPVTPVMLHEHGGPMAPKELFVGKSDVIIHALTTNPQIRSVKLDLVANLKPFLLTQKDAMTVPSLSNITIDAELKGSAVFKVVFSFDDKATWNICNESGEVSHIELQDIVNNGMTVATINHLSAEACAKLIQGHDKIHFGFFVDASGSDSSIIVKSITLKY